MNEKRPYTILKAAMSLDGCIDDTSSKRRIFSNELDMQAVDQLRAGCDAIFVGAETIRKDNPRLLLRSDSLRKERQAQGKSEDLLKVTLTGSAELSNELQFFTTGSAEKLVYCVSEQAAELKKSLSDVATVVPIDDSQKTVQLLLADLAKRGVERLLVEGGSSIIRQLLTEQLVDELRIAIAPFVIADAEAPKLISESVDFSETFTLRSVEQLQELAILWFKRSI